MEENKLINNYQILINQNNSVFTYYISTEFDLVAKYKDALINGQGIIAWENGVIDCKQLVGIIRS